jgi:hypothetical protein
MRDYDQEAQAFCDQYGIKIEWRFLHHEDRHDIKRRFRDTPVAWCNVWQFTMSRDGRTYSGKFTGSVHDACGKELERASVPNSFSHFPGWSKNRGTPPTQPSAYDLLACLTKSDPGSFENFCGEYGYDTDSRAALDIYIAVQAEWAGVQHVIPPEAMDEFQEIN